MVDVQGRYGTQWIYSYDFLIQSILYFVAGVFPCFRAGSGPTLLLFYQPFFVMKRAGFDRFELRSRIFIDSS
jgi:hypothetical protein